MKPSKRNNEAYGKKINLGAGEGMKPSERNTEAYGKDSI